MLRNVLEVYLSNEYDAAVYELDVLEVYRITLLSNTLSYMFHKITVLEVYRITLLSNIFRRPNEID